MKKRMLIFMMMVLVLTLGCSNTDSDSISKIKELESKIEELQKENVGLKAQLGIEATEVSALQNEESDSEEGNILSVGDVITTDRMEITIKKIELTYDVLPDDTSGFYTHYPADSGNVYIHIDTDVKNLQKQNLNCDDIMTVKADYNNGFTYKSMPIVEDPSTGFTYANITSIKPLESKGMRFLIDCPQEVEETNNPLFLNFNVDKQEYKYIIR